MRATSIGKVLRIINVIRGPTRLTTELFLNGQCYAFFQILHVLFPEAKPWYDHTEGHVYTKIGKYWYDIRGIHYKVSDTCKPLDHRTGDKPHRWGKRDKRILIFSKKNMESRRIVR